MLGTLASPLGSVQGGNFDGDRVGALDRLGGKNKSFIGFSFFFPGGVFSSSQSRGRFSGIVGDDIGVPPILLGLSQIELCLRGVEGSPAVFLSKNALVGLEGVEIGDCTAGIRCEAKLGDARELKPILDRCAATAGASEDKLIAELLPRL